MLNFDCAVERNIIANVCEYISNITINIYNCVK